jgi:hypothetical protein
MADRYSVVHRPRVELSAIEFGVTRPGTPIEQYCYQVEDSLADGDYIGGSYSNEAEAKAACDKLNKDN